MRQLIERVEAFMEAKEPSQEALLAWAGIFANPRNLPNGEKPMRGRREGLRFGDIIEVTGQGFGMVYDIREEEVTIENNPESVSMELVFFVTEDLEEGACSLEDFEIYGHIEDIEDDLEEGTGVAITKLHGRAMNVINSLRREGKDKLANELDKLVDSGAINFELMTGGLRGHIEKVRAIAKKIKGGHGAQIMAIADDLQNIDLNS